MTSTSGKLAVTKLLCCGLARVSIALLFCYGACLMLPLSKAIFASSTVLLGDQSIESTVGSNAAGTAQAFQTTATASGTVTALILYVDASNKATTLTVGIYTNSSGQPGTLLGQASTSSFTAGAWNAIAIPSVAIKTKTVYWIAVLGTGGASGFREGGTSCSSLLSSQTNLAALSASWSSGASNKSCNLSAYGATSSTPILSLSATSASFSATQGSGSNPAAVSINLANTGAGTLSFTTSSDSSWLSVTPASGSAPVTLQVVATLGTLAAGTYTGHITVTASGATGSPATITATLKVTAPPPALSLSTTTLSFNAVTGSGTNPLAASVSVTNTGGGTLSFTAKSSASWLSVSPTSGKAPNTLQISATLGKLAAGTYTGQITVTASGATGSPATIAVTFTVAPPPAVLSLSGSTVSFSATQGGAAPASASINVTNTGGGTLNFTTSSDSGWLSVSPASGTAPQTLQISATQASLAPGTYTGHIVVTATGAQGSPGTITATFTVAPGPPILSLSTTPLSFAGIFGSGTNPTPGSVNLSNAGGGTLAFTATTDSSWLTVTPSSGTAPQTLQISAVLGNLGVGTYSGNVIVTSSGVQGSPADIPVTFKVAFPPPSILFGDTNVESTLYSGAPVGQALAMQTVASASGPVTSLSVYLDGSSTASQIFVGLYGDSGGQPGTLLTQGSSSTLTAGGWNSIAVPVATVTSGSAYWIALLATQGGSPVYRTAATSTCASQTSSQSGLLTLPASWAAGTAGTVCPVSVYGVSDPSTLTFTISGTVTGTNGAIPVTLSGSANTTVTSDASGNYSFPGLANGGTYTVTPTGTGFVYTPPSETLVLNGANQAGVDFAAALPPPPTYSISGTISGPGGVQAPVALNGGTSPASTTTDTSGNYSFSGLPNGTYVVTPGLAGYVYSPASQSVTIANQSQSGVNFTSSPTYSISGVITPASNGSGAGAMVTLTGAASATTTANPSTGAYSFSGLLNGAYVVTPSAPGAGFSPASSNITLNGANQSAVNFTATALVFNPATITWTDTYQTIDGFGASNHSCETDGGYDTCGLTSAQADMVFSATAAGGIGISILRASVPDDGSCATTCDIPDTVIMGQALARGARIVAAPWSPPASMKTNGATTCSPGEGSLSSGSYGAYATYLTNYIQQLQNDGITLYAISVQNEPDQCPTYDGAVWTATNIHDFVENNLGPALAQAGLSTKIMIPETATSANLPSWANTTMDDPAAAAYVGIVATHDYASPGTANPVTYTTGGKAFWQTETSDFNSPDPSITSGLAYALEIHQWMTQADANAWLFWWLVNGNDNDNEGLIEEDGTVTKRFYTLGNFSRFVRPGYVRIDATTSPAAGVYVSAYKDPVSGNFAVVAINQSTSTVGVTFSLSGFTATTLTPWVTSATLSLVEEPVVQGTGSTFNGTLPPSSVTTFVGTDGN